MLPAVGIFFAVGTQWTWVGAGMAGAFRTGINYQSLEPTARSLKVELTPDVFNDIRTLESEALSVWSKRRT